MEHLRSLENLIPTNSWVTIGSFDGVHLGHQTLVRRLVESAHAAGSPAVVVTFFPHPAVVLRHIQEPYYLTHPDERAELLGNLGVDYVITLAFDDEMAKISSETFMQKLSAALGLQRLWVGHDFALGKDRKGDVATLKTIGERLGYGVEVIPPVTSASAVISSRLIRNFLHQGKVEEAARLLGRWFSVEGRVAHGIKRGRKLGFPTVNLTVWQEQLLPAPGVYANRVWIGEQLEMGVSNIGIRPTFKEVAPSPQLETHLLDFNGDLYGAILRVEFNRFLRSEQRFNSPDELTRQVQKDILLAREVLSDVQPTPDLSARPSKDQA